MAPKLYKPHKYQAFSINRALSQPEIGLFLDMGLGKTSITLTALVELIHNRFEVARPLIIGPKRVVESTWPEEIRKWAHTNHLRVSLMLGTQRQRIAALNAPADIWAINRENVAWLIQHCGKRWPFDMVVIDELSSFKSPTSRRFRALRRVRPMVKRVIGLTGTPAPNGLLDLWAQVYLLDQGKRLGTSFTAFRDQYFKPADWVRNANGALKVSKWEPRPGAEEEIFKKLEGLIVSLRAKDWLDFPERVNLEVPVTLPTKARRLYQQLERDLLLPFVGADVVANTAAALSNKLLQMANGAVYDETGEVQHIHDAKLDALEDLVESANGKSLLVFYSYRHDLPRIQERFPEARTLDTPNDIRDWNEGRIPIALAHPASAGHGLNLQRGGNHIVWFGLTWNLEWYQQANARLHRQGQTERVFVHHLVAKDTPDEDVMRALNHKGLTQESLLEAVKARIARYGREAA